MSLSVQTRLGGPSIMNGRELNCEFDSRSFPFQNGDFQYARGPEPLLSFNLGIVNLYRLGTDRYTWREISTLTGCPYRNSRAAVFEGLDQELTRWGFWTLAVLHATPTM